jgi:hypothetical protein
MMMVMIVQMAIISATTIATTDTPFATTTPTITCNVKVQVLNSYIFIAQPYGKCKISYT